MSLLRLLAVALVFSVGSLLSVGGASAATVQMTTPFTADVTNPCNGDVVHVVGFLHTVDTLDGAGDHEQTNYQGTTGVSLDGTRYQANLATHDFFIATSADDFTSIHRDDYELISQSPSENFMVHDTIFVHVHNGDVDIRFTPDDGVKCTG